ncbi:uncharacterized protein LOC128929670 [Callithrix jacchus]
MVTEITGMNLSSPCGFTLRGMLPSWRIQEISGFHPLRSVQQDSDNTAWESRSRNLICLNLVDNQEGKKRKEQAGDNAGFYCGTQIHLCIQYREDASTSGFLICKRRTRIPGLTSALVDGEDKTG